MHDAFEKCVVPSGAVCFYKDSTHSYYRDIRPKLKRDLGGEWQGMGRLTGVSTVVGPADFRPDALLRWAARTNGIGVAMLAAETLQSEMASAAELKDELAWLNSADSMWRALQERSLTHEDVRDERGDEGHGVHEHALHALASGDPVPAYGEMTDVERGYAQGVTAFWLDHDPTPEYTEQVVMDLDLGVAGRLDLIARLGAYCGDPECPCKGQLIGSRFLGDLKTGKYLFAKAHAQVGGGYEHCARVSGFGASDAQWLLQVDAEGGYKVVECRANADDFVAFVDAYRRSVRISKEAKVDRKAREEMAG